MASVVAAAFPPRGGGKPPPPPPRRSSSFRRASPDVRNDGVAKHRRSSSDGPHRATGGSPRPPLPASPPRRAGTTTLPPCLTAEAKRKRLDEEVANLRRSRDAELEALRTVGVTTSRSADLTEDGPSGGGMCVDLDGFFSHQRAAKGGDAARKREAEKILREYCGEGSAGGDLDGFHSRQRAAKGGDTARKREAEKILREYCGEGSAGGEFENVWLEGIVKCLAAGDEGSVVSALTAGTWGASATSAAADRAAAALYGGGGSSSGGGTAAGGGGGKEEEEAPEVAGDDAVESATSSEGEGGGDSSSPIRVAVRIRPALPASSAPQSSPPSSASSPPSSCIKILRDESSSSSPCASIRVGGSDGPTFDFDSAFPEHATQDDVYDTCVKPLVDACLEGFNATAFAYGPTGSGKTHTMIGPSPPARPDGGAATRADGGDDGGLPSEEEDEGSIPRALRELFRRLEERRRDAAAGGAGRAERSSDSEPCDDGRDVAAAARAAPSPTSVAGLADEPPPPPSPSSPAGVPDFEYEVRAQFLEIYGEEIRDLLSFSPSPSRPSSSSSSSSMPKTTIRDGKKGTAPGEPEVVNAAQPKIANLDDALRCLKRGMDRRVTGDTKINGNSSRSHVVLTIAIEQRRRRRDREGEEETEAIKSKFHFVDLAGSERAKKTNSQGKRFKEGVDINKGLLVLGNVIDALSRRSAATSSSSKRKIFVPYRDSKLTRLLRGSLGGSHKTCMIACVSPLKVDMEETLNCLRYASRASTIRNRTIPNVVRSESDENGNGESAKIVEELRGQVRLLASELLLRMQDDDGNDEQKESSKRRPSSTGRRRLSSQLLELLANGADPPSELDARKIVEDDQRRQSTSTTSTAATVRRAGSRRSLGIASSWSAASGGRGAEGPPREDAGGADAPATEAAASVPRAKEAVVAGPGGRSDYAPRSPEDRGGDDAPVEGKDDGRSPPKETIDVDAAKAEKGVPSSSSASPPDDDREPRKPSNDGGASSPAERPTPVDPTNFTFEASEVPVTRRVSNVRGYALDGSPDDPVLSTLLRRWDGTSPEDRPPVARDDGGVDDDSVLASLLRRWDRPPPPSSPPPHPADASSAVPTGGGHPVPSEDDEGGGPPSSEGTRDRNGAGVGVATARPSSASRGTDNGASTTGGDPRDAARGDGGGATNDAADPDPGPRPPPPSSGIGATRSDTEDSRGGTAAAAAALNRGGKRGGGTAEGSSTSSLTRSDSVKRALVRGLRDLANESMRGLYETELRALERQLEEREIEREHMAFVLRKLSQSPDAGPTDDLRERLYEKEQHIFELRKRLYDLLSLKRRGGGSSRSLAEEVEAEADVGEGGRRVHAKLDGLRRKLLGADEPSRGASASPPPAAAEQGGREEEDRRAQFTGEGSKQGVSMSSLAHESRRGSSVTSSSRTGAGEEDDDIPKAVYLERMVSYERQISSLRLSLREARQQNPNPPRVSSGPSNERSQRRALFNESPSHQEEVFCPPGWGNHSSFFDRFLSQLDLTPLESEMDA